MSRNPFNTGFLFEVELVPELYENDAIKQEIIDELTYSFGNDIRIPISEAYPGTQNRVGGMNDRQAREIVFSIIRRHMRKQPAA